MQMLKMSKKGFAIGDLLPIALTFVVTGIAIAYGLQVMGDVKGDMTLDSLEYNATTQAQGAVAKIPSKMGLLVTVVIAAIVIMVLIRYLAGGVGGGKK